MKKIILIVSFMVVAVVVTISLLIPNTDNTTQGEQQSTLNHNTTPIPIKDIKSEIVSELNSLKDTNYSGDISVEDIKYYKEWFAARVTLLDEPAESQSHTMVYIFKRQGESDISLVAFSGDYFTEDSFHSDTPDDVVTWVEGIIW